VGNQRVNQELLDFDLELI